MAHEGKRFQNAGLTWTERAALGGLRSVLAPQDSVRTLRNNSFLHGVHSYAAQRTINRHRKADRVVDFGCGNGRFLRLFSGSGRLVIGTEITAEMARSALREDLPGNAGILLTDGISIPLKDNSVDLIWCCAVLRYSLLTQDPVYDLIASEMFRVLRPGGCVVNLEMYVEEPADVFIRDFENAGFQTAGVHVINRYNERLERLLKHRLVSDGWMTMAGRICARLRFLFDSEKRNLAGLRDYLFAWEKPQLR